MTRPIVGGHAVIGFCAHLFAHLRVSRTSASNAKRVATSPQGASRSVLSVMQAALDVAPLLTAAPGVASLITGALAAWR